jgi:hypothetical protein
VVKPAPVLIIVDRGEGIRYKLASCNVGTGRLRERVRMFNRDAAAMPPP